MTWIAAMTTGAGLGLAFYGGLWLTVRQLVWKQRHKGFLVASGFVRLALVGLVLYGLGCEGVDKMVAGVTGLWLARGCLIRQLGEVRHEG